MTKEEGLTKLKAKVTAFYAEDLKTMNETETRQKYIDVLFRCLGWDTEGKEVIVEESETEEHEDQRVRRGRVDYRFAVDEHKTFIVEAKKPKENLESNKEHAYQARLYAFNADHPLVVLTDFEEFAVYYGRGYSPQSTDATNCALFKKIAYTDYIKEWDWLYSIFSREAVANGSLEKHAKIAKGKRGDQTVDEVFLKDIQQWRSDLAQNIYLRNPYITLDELNYAVQMTLDRIIFLRICEDRNIEPYETLKKVSQKPGVYTALKALFLDADKVYNSGLFHFKDESGREGKDCITPDLHIDDDVLCSIIGRMYYPLGPYLFAVMPADILGQVYERFLGKVIDIDNGTVSIIDKPEVKKAGGVFYTPEYIVDYIVKNTVGKLLDEAPVNSTKAKTGRAKKIPPPESGGAGGGKQLTPAEASKLRILDPACGSGAFLINAYQYLLDWHLAWYKTNDPEKWAEVIRGKKGKDGKPAAVEKDGKGVWRLTLSERKRILSNNIYGVDIDRQAVEVTKLSLLLKCLELEGKKAIQQEFTFFKERALPDLDNNIKCGNSLIERDIFKQGDFDEQEKRRINPFNWQDKFKSIMDEGGFDAVIGNPPYVRVQLLAHKEIDYLFKTYNCASSKIDLSVFFIERALQLISSTGLTGFITTKQWMTTDYGKGVRKLLSNGYLHHVIDFGSLPVFTSADTYPAIIVCSKTISSSFGYGRIDSKDDLNESGINNVVLCSIQFDKLSETAWNLSEFDVHELCRTRKIPLKLLSEFGHVFIGALTGMDEAFVYPRSDIDKKSLSSEFIFPYAYRGAEVSRYCEVIPASVAIYPYTENGEGESVLVSESDFRKGHSLLYEYLSVHKSALRKRLDSRKLYADVHWFRYLRPGSYRYIRPAKLIFKGIDIRLSVGLLGKNTLFNGANTPAFIPEHLGKISLNYLLGILNSKLIGYHLSGICPPKLGGYFRFNASNINKTPIRTINFNNPTEKQMHDDLVKLVTDMLKLNKELAKAKLPNDIETKKDEIKEKDTEIDALVYKLYGLTKAEIAIVEGV